MKEYFVKRIDVNEATKVMNQYAKEGWRVVSTALQVKTLKDELIVTFEKDKD